MTALVAASYRDDGKTTEMRMDFVFRCNHCIKLIPQDRNVYMRQDSTYCSTACRHRGRSALYANLRSLQLDRLYGLKAPAPESNSAKSTAFSESSLSSSRCTDWSKPGPFGWVLLKVLDAISTHLPIPASLVRAASSAVLTRIRPGSSLHRLLGDVTGANSFLGLANGPPTSEVSEPDSPRAKR
mmetsp:Transcript_3066/g.8761  ORF Transcript_3066/g.8761 Transcript_3066/m.8761 type:complete len:184 (+) Transcript_3066:88-639(+)|eukprot:CAMPEP_0176221504 /NCGR_PEP_ID=MMETSP0121_2-20121125/19760_1 /TAXON_ID=160619 /ORGANISM="Kryptoperidinium foliaceum, Strain CCMP 1326" /LENGTH=183 /DNA_ID=CAMNT_0017560703 /DNA_START=70 /DNA_END=621 /DNA_ORIENTATION=+